jgi:hypothetical protein
MDGEHISCDYGYLAEDAAPGDRLRLGENTKLHFKRGRFETINHSAIQASSPSPKQLEKRKYENHI